ncbi:hypothetical protein GWK26_12605 [haloarchaeon 3A1-DGR]|nr:hypothetical protein GWK26_12605 [haloarchaeon 3A1-DGR]
MSGAQYRFNREQYTEGDELEVPERVAERHPRSLEVIGDGDDESADAGDEDTPDAEDGAADSEGGDEPPDFGVDLEEVDPHPNDLSVSELRDRISDVNDVDLLQAIRHLESESEDRKTALEAIDDRIAAVEEE